MAIAYQNSSAWTEETGSSADLVISKPANTAEGDLLIAHIANDDDDGWNALPTGWTAIYNQEHDNRMWMVTAWKIAGASEPSSYTFTHDVSNEAKQGWISRFTGQFDTNPIDVSATASGCNCSTATHSSLTPTQTPTMLVAVYGANAARNTTDDTNYPPGYTGVYSRDTTAGSGNCAAGMAYKAYTGTSATGAATTSLDSSERTLGGHFAIYEDGASSGTTVDCGTASQALEAENANINKEDTTACGTASQALAGVAATVNKELTITLTHGEQAIDDPDAGINKEKTITLGVDEQALDDINVTVTLGGAVTIDCVVADQALAAVALTVNKELSITLPDAEQALEAVNAGVNREDTTTANVADQALQGVSATIQKAFVVMAGVADQAFQGVGADISVVGQEVLEPYTIGSSARILLPPMPIRKRKGKKAPIQPTREDLEKIVEREVMKKVEPFEFEPTKQEVALLRESAMNEVQMQLALTLQSYTHMQFVEAQTAEQVDLQRQIDELRARIRDNEDLFIVTMALQ